LLYVQHFIEIFLKTLNQGGSIKGLLNMVNPLNNKRKNSIKQRATINNNKSITFVFIIFFLAALMFGLFVRSTDVLAKPTFTRGPIECDANPETNLIKCCQDETGSKGITIRWCTVCLNTVPPSSCGERFPESKGRPGNNVIAPPPSGVAPPSLSTDQGTTLSPSTDVNKPSVKDNTSPLSPSTSQRVFSPTEGCVPGGTTCLPCDPGLPGANCIPSDDWRPSSNAPGGGSATPPNVPPPAQGGAIEQPPSNVAPPLSPSRSDNLASSNNDNNNNPQSENHHQKSKGNNDLLGQTDTGGELASKKGNNNDNSPTPPACPDKGPIPPNCTLKPKF
jgi:hypothetical protein